MTTTAQYSLCADDFSRGNTDFGIDRYESFYGVIKHLSPIELGILQIKQSNPEWRIEFKNLVINESFLDKLRTRTYSMILTKHNYEDAIRLIALEYLLTGVKDSNRLKQALLLKKEYSNRRSPKSRRESRKLKNIIQTEERLGYTVKPFVGANQKYHLCYVYQSIQNDGFMIGSISLRDIETLVLSVDSYKPFRVIYFPTERQATEAAQLIRQFNQGNPYVINSQYAKKPIESNPNKIIELRGYGVRHNRNLRWNTGIVKSHNIEKQ